MGNRSLSSLSSTLVALATLLVLGGCAPPASSTPPIVVHWDPPTPTPGPTGGHAPDVGGITPFATSGAYTFESPLAHGTARLEAVVVDMTSETPPTSVGTGSFDVPVDGTTYSGVGAEAIASTLPDTPDQLVLAAFVMETDTSGIDVGSVIWLVLPTAEAVVGTPVEIDGEARVALFGHGPIDTESPEITAAAATGTITFEAVDLALGGHVTATLSAEMGRIAWSDVDPGPGPGPGPMPGDPPIAVAAGAYDLVLSGPADVFCDGTMSGREVELSALAPTAVGIEAGAVTIADDGAGTLTLSGPAIGASFATPSVTAGWESDASFYLGSVDRSAPGPLGTSVLAGFVFVAPYDAAAIDAFVGVVVATDPAAPEAGSCQIGYPATLTPVTR